MTKKPRTLLWLEDVTETVPEQIIHARRMGLDVCTVANLPRFANRLYEGGVCGIVLDIMIIGMNDLNVVDMDVSTDGGYEAGWVLLEHYLRSPDGPAAIQNIPVIVLSSRALSAEYKAKLDNINKGKPQAVEYIEKGEEEWEEKFYDWLKNL